VHKKQHKRLYTGTSANSCDKKRPQYYNHVWSYDFLTERLESGTRVRLLVVIDEYTRESLAIDVARNFSSQDVILPYRSQRSIPEPSDLPFYQIRLKDATCLLFFDRSS
jgi:hypothetical protein